MYVLRNCVQISKRRKQRRKGSRTVSCGAILVAVTPCHDLILDDVSPLSESVRLNRLADPLYVSYNEERSLMNEFDAMKALSRLSTLS